MNFAGKDIRLIIMDLDGTLLQSTFLWDEIDEIFFERRGMSVPKGYGQKIVQMGLEAGAKWTKETYCPSEKAEDILKEWRDASTEAYHERITLKLGAREILDQLAARDIPIALATANSKDLYLPCLKRLQILDYFDSIVDVDDVKEGKHSSKIYDVLTERYGLSKDNVMVCEDALGSIKTAHNAGYLTVAVWDFCGNVDANECEENSDLYIDNWLKFTRELDKHRPLPILEADNFKVRRFNKGYEILGLVDPNIDELIIPETILGKRVYRIGESAFEENAFTRILLPEGLTSIGSSAFFHSSKAKEIIIPSTVNQIQYCAFSGSSFTRVEFKGDVLELGDSFGGLPNLKEIVLPEGFKELPFRGFWLNETIEEINLPEGLRVISSQAFNKCTNLKKVTLPHSLKRISDSAFYRCPNIQEVYYRGSQEEKEKIIIEFDGNHTLLSAKWIYLG